MSGLMNKVKDVLSSDKNNTAEAEANKGPHDYHHDHSSTSGGAGSYGANPTHGGLDQSSTSRDPMHSGRDDLTGRTTDTSGYGSHSTGSTTTGPHSSSMANKADPRVDSDRDGSGFGRDTTGSGLTGSGTHGSSGLDRTTGGSGLTGSNTTGSGYGSSDYDRTTGGSGLTGSTTSGPHSSSMANKADPRVDSDRDGRRGVETGSGTTGSGMTGSGITGHHGHHGDTDIIHGGEHHTETANRLDPHVSGGRGPLEHATVEGGSGLGGSSSGGYGSSTGNTSGPHSSSMANKADPRVDSDRDGRRGLETGSGNTGGYGSSTGTTGGYGSSTGGTGYNDNTSSTTGTSGAGPHNSGMMNKLDPRVDSDRDGSRLK
ncbi:MAG: hypothetical protein Q9208_007979 [Pyrenodesmia sp. 3 TL-2023]